MVKRVRLSPDIEAAILKSGLDLNELLRKSLGIKPKTITTPEGVEIPEGSDLMVWYTGKAGGTGRPYWARVVDGKVEMRGKRFDSVSAAAAEVTGRATTNGWQFWQVKFPGTVKFIPLSELRKPGADTAIREVTDAAS